MVFRSSFGWPILLSQGILVCVVFEWLIEAPEKFLVDQRLPGQSWKLLFCSPGGVQLIDSDSAVCVLIGNWATIVLLVTASWTSPEECRELALWRNCYCLSSGVGVAARCPGVGDSLSASASLTTLSDGPTGVG